MNSIRKTEVLALAQAEVREANASNARLPKHRQVPPHPQRFDEMDSAWNFMTDAERSSFELYRVRIKATGRPRTEVLYKWLLLKS